MDRRLAAGVFAAALAFAGCTGITSEVKPGDSMAKLCEAGRALADAVDLSRASASASESGDGMAAADLAARADTRRQDGMALVGWAADLEGHLHPASAGFSDRERELAAAQKAVDLAVGVLGAPAAPVTVEARPRLLAAAEEAVRAVGLPERCTMVEMSSATP